MGNFQINNLSLVLPNRRHFVIRNQINFKDKLAGVKEPSARSVFCRAFMITVDVSQGETLLPFNCSRLFSGDDGVPYR